MKRMRMQFFMVSLAIIFIVGNSYAQNQTVDTTIHVFSFTLAQAQDYAIENSYKSRIADYDIQEAEYTVKETMAIGLPQINADASYNNNIKLPVTILPAEFVGGPPGESVGITFGTKNTISANIMASQLVFDGTYLIGLKGTKVFRELKLQQKGATDFEVKKNTSDAYYAAMVSVENYKMLRENYDEVKKQLVQTQALYENGFVEEQNVQQLDLNLGKIEIAVNNAKRQIEIARNMLKFQLGMPMNDELILTDDINTLITNAKLEISGRYTFDIKNNVQYRVADKWVEVRDMQIRLEKSKYLPSLNVFINQNWSSYEDSFTYFSSGTSWFDATKFGVNLVVPILSSNQRGARVQKARVISEKARVQREELAAGLQLQLSVANSNFNQAFASYQIAVKNVELATSIRNKTNIKFQEGIATSFEVTQAESQLISDQFNVIESALRLFEAKTKIDELLNN